MINSPTQQSNPFSTGGGGSNFETRIQAAFTVLMLTGRVSPGLPPWSITKLKLQGRYAGFNTDDFIVFTKDSKTQNEAKLLGQIKHDISINEGNETFCTVIQAAWNDFNDSNVFNATNDVLALITGPLSSTDINNVRPLLEWARHSEDEIEFLNKVNTDYFSSDPKRAKLKVFRSLLNKANGNIAISDKQLWEFLKSFHLLGYDLDLESGNTLSLIQSLIAQYSHENPLPLWSRILDAVQSANQNAGTITLETLPQDIRNLFDTRKNQKWESDLKRIKEHGEYIIDGIRMDIGGVHIKRPAILSRLLEASESSKFVFISGARGCGKSSVVREFSEYMADRNPVFCLRTEDLDKAHLDNVFSSMGLENSIGDIEAGFALMPKRYLLIESIEKLLELEHSTAFTDLLHFLNKHLGWTIIATGRDYAYQQVMFNFLQPSGVTHSSITIDNFDDHEVQQLCEKIEPLKTIAENSSLSPLLKNPFIAELAYRVSETGIEFSSGDGEKEFREAVWRNIIAREQIRTEGLPLKRKQVFIEVAVLRAKQMVYGVPEENFDSETLLKLEEDNLIRRATNGLVSPAHDVLEDWALERYIEHAYQQTSGNMAKFLDAIGDEPAINRAFRLWLHQRLKYSDNVNDLIFAILKSHEIQRYWQDETISAVLLGQTPDSFLEELRDQLLESEGELLKRFCFILRISCKTPDQDLIKQLSGSNKAQNVLDTLFLKPFGHGWDAVIRFLFENRESVSTSLVPHIIAVLDEWASSIHLEEDLPAIAREAGLLGLYLLNYFKDSYRDDGNRKKVIRVIIRTVSAIENEFNELLNTDVFKTNDEQRRPHYVQEFCKVALESIETVFLCKQIPDTLIKFAFHEWLVAESQNEDTAWRGMHLGVEEYFGLHLYRNEFFPASGAKGPFQHLLRFHPRKGIDFIIQLLNLTAEKYARSTLDSHNRYSPMLIKEEDVSAKQIEIQLDDQTAVKQYCSGRLWVGYRGHSVLPYLLQSALMALENYLINLAEYSESPKILEYLFDYILRNSNSVMPTAVLVSVATGFPNKLWKAALPLLRTPELYDLDIERIVHERGGNEINWFASGFQRPFADLYAEERRKAALRPWRREHLETLIIRLQFLDLRQEAFAVIDELRSKAPQGDAWRFRFHRIDSRGWEAEEDKENSLITFKPKNLEADLEEIQQETQAKTALMNRFSQLYLWSEKIFGREALDREYFVNWDEALTEAKNLLEILENGSGNNLARMHYSGIVKAAAVFLRDHSNEMSEEDAHWCVKFILQTVVSNADTQDQFVAADKTDLDGAAVAASLLPILLDHTEDGEEKLLVKTIIATALTHANEKVRQAIANGIREYLWQRDPEFAQRCILGIIEYARLEVEHSHQRREAYFSPDTDGETYDANLRVWLNSFREQLANGDLSLTTDGIDKIDFLSYSPWFILNPSLMIPDGSIEPSHVVLLSRMLTLFFITETSLRKHYSDRAQDDIHIHYELRIPFTNRFASYLLELPEPVIQSFIEQLREGCDTAPEFIDHLLMNIAFITERSQKKEVYWEFWNQFSKKVQTIANETVQHRSDYGRQEGSRKLIRGMLCADAPWQKLDYENQDIALGKELILEFVNNAGKNADVFEAMASLMYHFPKIFFETGIQILAKHQAEITGTQLFSGVNTAYYLEGAIRRFLQVDETGALSRAMHQSCFVLLDAIVETASSGAYYLREQLIRSRRII
ncbi:MAG: ATP-binding protein [Acidobacteriota bacterium]